MMSRIAERARMHYVSEYFVHFVFFVSIYEPASQPVSQSLPYVRRRLQYYNEQEHTKYALREVENNIHRYMSGSRL